MAQPLLEKIDPDLYLAGAEVSERYAVDWSAENPVKPEVVLRPRSTADVATLLRLCNEAEQRLVVQGGLTGLSGGATPQTGEWALSLERINNIQQFDTTDMCITVGAGIALEHVQQAVAAEGFFLPLDLGARGSCTIGGNVSTNAGGNQVIQYGMTRALVLGLTAVLADGTIIPANNVMLKNNAGFDLKQLFIGSEGALGIVTEVTLRLFPAKSAAATALCAVSSFSAVTQLLEHAGRQLDAVSSFEVMWTNYYREAVRVEGVSRPFDDDIPYYVLIETTGAHAQSLETTFLAALESAMEAGLVDDAVIAQSESERAGLWAIRDAISELLPQFTPAANFDIGLPVSAMEAFSADIEAEFQTLFPACRRVMFGHIGDGNLHILATTGKPDDVRAIYDMIYRRLSKFGGTITAEHGVGWLKRDWLAECRSEAEIDLMRTLKATLDPKRILNAGRILG
ncbi:MAG: FAD-binding oxidoreductase [Pseudomonadota bacterium]